MKKLEALADSIIAYTLYTDPASAQYRFRNPLGLLVFCSHRMPYKQCPDCKITGPVGYRHPFDTETGIRIFSTYLSGYSSGLFDLELKCTGRSGSKVRSDSTLRELIRSYFLPDGTTIGVSRFLRKALRDDTINEKTRIHYFMGTV